jgi:oligopeptide transport system ATP-binding protein
MAESIRREAEAPARPLLDVRRLSVTYPGRGPRRAPVHAVNEVSLRLERGETLGLVGESGCGKTTFAKALLGLEPSNGEIALDGVPLPAARTRDHARRIQIVFQDPYASLNPRMSVRAMLSEMLRVHRLAPRDGIDARARELVELVGLPRRALDVRPAALSGGQRQRVAIARALSLDPDVLVADEPTTALDVSVQAVILELFAQLRDRLGLGLLLITHNLAVVSAICDRTAVMYLGRIVEEAPTAALLADPRHPYTRRLVAAVPRLGIRGRARLAALPGDPPDPANIPSGCPFHPRCPEATEHCAVVRPELTVGTTAFNGQGAGLHLAACHYAWQPAATARSPGTSGQKGV